MFEFQYKEVILIYKPTPIFYFDLFNGISTYLGYLMPNPSLEKNSSGTINP